MCADPRTDEQTLIISVHPEDFSGGRFVGLCAELRAQKP